MAREEVVEIFVKAARDMGITDKLVVKREVWATDVTAYRADMGYCDASKKAFTVNNQWVAALPPSAQSLVKLWEECRPSGARHGFEGMQGRRRINH